MLLDRGREVGGRRLKGRVVWCGMKCGLVRRGDIDTLLVFFSYVLEFRFGSGGYLM
jgi:hypothetical protein